jgi:hypothetical protein
VIKRGVEVALGEDRGGNEEKKQNDDAPLTSREIGITPTPVHPRPARSIPPPFRLPAQHPLVYPSSFSHNPYAAVQRFFF